MLLLWRTNANSYLLRLYIHLPLLLSPQEPKHEHKHYSFPRNMNFLFEGYCVIPFLKLAYGNK
jgi:hypothetical protein